MRYVHLVSVAAIARAATWTRACALIFAACVPAFSAAQPPREFRWAGDPEGGAPFVEADPANPDKLVGFDVEVADLLARGLGRTPTFVLIQFSSIDQSIARGDADIGLSGIEERIVRIESALRLCRQTSHLAEFTEDPLD